MPINVGAPYGLLHKANPPGIDAVMGLAAYKGTYGMEWHVHSLTLNPFLS